MNIAHHQAVAIPIMQATIDTATEEAQRRQAAQTSYDTNVDVKVWNYSPPDRQSDDQRIKKGW